MPTKSLSDNQPMQPGELQSSLYLWFKMPQALNFLFDTHTHSLFRDAHKKPTVPEGNTAASTIGEKNGV